MTPALEVKELNVVFRTETADVHAVRDVSFSVPHGTTFGIVGESGSGKSVTCQAVMGLTPANGTVTAEAIRLDGRDIGALSDAALDKVRGRDMAMVFQDPMTALNPVHSIGRQIAESLRLHRGMDRRTAHAEACELLALVGFPEPEQRLRDFPHQLSGGMTQRAMIAMALACRPALLFADEPSTALDVTVQAQILDLLKRLQHEFGMTIVLITHDFGVIVEMAETVAVMRDGRIVEAGPVDEMFANPTHPYTQRLLEQIPRLDHPSPIYTPPVGIGT